MANNNHISRTSSRRPRQRHTRVPAALTVLSLSTGALLGSCVIAAPATAATAVSSSMLYFETNSATSTQLWAGPMGEAASGLAPVGSPHGFVVYAIAADPTTGKLYGFARTAGVDSAGAPLEIGDLVHIDTADGTTTALGPISDLGVTGAGNSPWAATFGPDGTMYVWGPSSTALFAVDVASLTATQIPVSGALSAGDITWSQGYLWAVPTSSAAVITRIDPHTGEVTSFAGPDALSAGPVSAIATLANGNLLVSVGNTVPSTALNIEISDAATSTPAFRLVSSTTVDQRFNDGASISTVSDPTVNPASGSGRMSGSGTPGDTIVITDANGTEIGRAIIRGDGIWATDIDPALTSGGEVTVTSINPAGSTAQISTTTTIPEAPESVTSDGSTVSGTGPAGATVTVTDATTGETIGTGTVGADGTFTVTISPALADGATANVTLTDAEGNVSDPSVVTAQADATDSGDGTDDPAAASAPDASKTTANAESVNGLAGAAQPGSSITVTDPTTGEVLGTGTVRPDGSFTVAVIRELADGEKVNVTATDKDGNVSAATSVTADTVAPAVPAVTGSEGKIVSGTGEPGSTVVVTDRDGNILGSAVVDPNGNWKVELESEPKLGDIITVTAVDASGNVSDTGVYQYERVAGGGGGGYAGTDDRTAAEKGGAAAKGASVHTGGQLANVSDTRETTGWWAALLALLGAGLTGGAVALGRTRRQRQS